MELGAIVGRLVLDDQFTGALNNATDNAKKSMSDVQKHVAVATGAVLAMGAAMLGLAVRTAKVRDEMARAAAAAGLPVQAYGKLQYAAKMADVSTETLGRSLRRLVNPSQEVQNSLRRMGIQFADNNGRMVPQQVLLERIADRFKNMGNDAQRARESMALFGERGADMVNMLKDGSEGLREMGIEAEKLGLIFDEKAAAEADKFGDSLDKVSFAVDGLTQSVSQSIIEFVNQSGILEKLSDIISDVTGYWNSLDDETQNTIITMGAVAVGIAAVGSALLALTLLLPVVKAAFVAAFITNPVGLIMTGIALATGLIIAKWKELSAWVKPVVDSFSKLWTSIKALGSSLDDLFNSFSSQEKSDIDEVATALKAVFVAPLLMVNTFIFALDTVIRSLKLIADLVRNEMRIEQQIQARMQEIRRQREREGGEGWRAFIGAVKQDPASILSENARIRALAVQDLREQLDKMDKEMISRSDDVAQRIASNGVSWADQQMTIIDGVITRRTAQILRSSENTGRDTGRAFGANLERGFNERIEKGEIKIKVALDIKDPDSTTLQKIQNAFKKAFTIGGTAGQTIGGSVFDLFGGPQRIAQQMIDSASFRRDVTRIITNAQGQEEKKTTKEEAVSEEEAKRLREKFKKAFREGGFEELNKSLESEGVKGGDALIKGMEGAIAGGAGAIADSIVKIIGDAYKMWQDVIQNKLENIRRKTELLDWSSKMITQWLAKQNAIELAMIEDTENAKISVMRQAQVEKLALIDEEFAARKKQLEEELKLRIAAERIAFEERKKVLESRSADDEQRRLAVKVMEDDWAQYIKTLEEETQQKIAETAEQGQQKRAEATVSSNAIIEQAETNKTAMIDAKRKEQEQVEKNHAKQVMGIRYALDFQAFELNKRLQLAQITMQLGQNLMSASQAAASMFVLGPAALVIGPMVFATLAGMAYNSYAMARASIASAVLLPPPELFAAEGGKIMGPSHAMGGVPVRAEGGETILSRGLTDKLERSLDGGGGVVVTISQGAIVINGVNNFDPRVVEQIAEAVGRKIEQRRY